KPDKDGRITPKEFTGPRELFMRLDRDRDGAITVSDFDWTDASPFGRQLSQASAWLRQMGPENKLTRDGWNKLFDKFAQGKDYLNAEDMRAMLNPPVRSGAGGPPSMPSKSILVKGLASGELGSGSEGPRLGQRAPDFTLATHDGKRSITLSK